MRLIEQPLKLTRTFFNTSNELELGDLTQINPQSLPDFDLLVSGFPCQSFSIVGKREGLENKEKGQIIFYLAEILKAKQPSFFILENVKGLLNHNKGQTLKEILKLLELKLVSNNQGFNQIDKRWLKTYNELWNFPKDIYEILQYFVGEKEPKIENPKDKRRMFFNEFSQKEQDKILNFFNENKILILNDILKGRGQFASEWFLVILRLESNIEWVLKPINEVINFYGGEVVFSLQGSLKIGKVTMQRKGGDGGRESAKMLQFKINPLLLMQK